MCSVGTVSGQKHYALSFGGHENGQGFIVQAAHWREHVR